jgi:hypothetical protein
MNLNEFYREFATVAKRMRRDNRFPGKPDIRLVFKSAGSIGARCYCPITAVAYHKTRRWYPTTDAHGAGMAVGLSIHQILYIIGAADKLFSPIPRERQIRKRLTNILTRAKKL